MIRRLFGLLMLLLFFGMFALGVVYGLNSWQLTAGGKTATGTVVGYNESRDDDGFVSFKPIVQFEVGGQVYVINSPNASRPPAYDIGQQVELLYNPVDPGNARIDNFWELWLLPIIFASIGGLLSFLMLGGIFMGIWRRLRGESTTL